MYQSETDRFLNSEKNIFGAFDKQRKQKVHQNKLRKLAEWQGKNEQNVKSLDKRH